VNWPRPIRVIGCGSPHGDDAVAWQVVARLRNEKPALDAELHSVSGGHAMLNLLDGTGSLVLIDAVSAGTESGTIHRLDWPTARAEVLRPGSTHALRPAEALQLASSLGLLPSHVIVWGIEVTGVQPGLGLSRPVAEAVVLLARRVVEELRHA